MAYSIDPDFFAALDRLSIGSTPRHGTPQNRVHDKGNLQKLYDKAKVYVTDKGATKRSCNVLYRDKPRAYFDDIKQNNDGVMETYQKDYHGDPKSPVNRRINGLFFTANVMRMTGEPPTNSIYGPRRFLVPVKHILTLAPNAYFTDFYCVMKDTHYITLILTSSGSESDSFCKEHLIPFDLEDNPFFCRKAYTFVGGGYFEVTDGLWVEILVTENIDLAVEEVRGAHWQDVTMTGQRSGGATGLVKNANCHHCNI